MSTKQQEFVSTLKYGLCTCEENAAMPKHICVLLVFFGDEELCNCCEECCEKCETELERIQTKIKDRNA